jgi:hypothetical protein
MTNRFYDNVNDLIPMTRARSQAVEDNFDAVEAAFDLAQVEINASIRGPDNETLGRLPSAGSRANKGLVFDVSGQPAVTTLATQAEMDAAVQAASDSLSYLNSFRGQYLGPLAADPSVDALGNAVGTGDIYFNTVSLRLKVYSGSTWTNGVDTSVAGAVPDTRLISTGAGLTGGGNLTADRTLSISNNGVTDAMLRQGTATSIIGRSAGTTGNVADIAASLDDRFLVRRAGALTFGLLASGDVTGALGFTPADTAGQYYTGTHNFGGALQVSGNAVWHAGTFDKTLYATLASPTFTGTVTVPEPPGASNNQTVATTAFVMAKVGSGGYVPTARLVSAGTGLSGGGDLSVDRTISFNEAGYGDLRYMRVAGGTFTGIAITATPSSGGAGFRLPHGAAPSAPVNGDVWTTTADLLARINGTTRTFWHNGNLTPSNYAPLSSPTFTGTPAAPTAAADTNTTQLATTAFVIGQGYLKSATASSTYQTQAGMSSYAQLASANFTTLQRGGSNVWTEASLTNLNQLTNGPGYITSSSLSGYAQLASSPVFTGVVKGNSSSLGFGAISVTTTQGTPTGGSDGDFVLVY